MILRGEKASPGKIKGRIFKIKDTTKPVKPKPGYIIVANFTTPVIAIALSQARGIICEVGGITSHGAIIAREFNIPCLVGVKGALKKLEDEQEIILDAGRGKVYET